MAHNWGHVARHCVYCGEVGPRVQVAGGFAHRRCVPKVGRRKVTYRCSRCGGRHKIGVVCVVVSASTEATG
jgi:hypothetical protein